ncbi:hypothetical protein Acsp01_67510 [Actinoplanes sp. NBRC 101535]|nr:hypothetical protein Acsp01_67510 [Actinoplanes sp. NBRC 101535]
MRGWGTLNVMTIILTPVHRDDLPGFTDVPLATALNRPAGAAAAIPPSWAAR